LQTKIGRWGNSLALRIPAAFAEDAALTDGATVELTLVDGEIRITPVHLEPRLDELLASITDENRHDETDWGKPVGGEAW
jgi:antitoxin MazE